MRALVTGAGGFVGRYLVELLLVKGYSVLAAVHRRAGTVFQQSAVPEWTVDITSERDVVSLLSEVAPVDEVYHLAGIARTDADNPSPYYNVNLMGTVNLLEAIRCRSPKARVLVVSSAQVYGNVPRERQPIREERSLRPVNHYGASKAAAEAVASVYAAEGLHVVVARAFNHTGPGQTVDFICSRLARQAVETEVGQRSTEIELGNLESGRDFTDVRDVVRAYWLLLQRGRRGEVYNVCSGRTYSVREILDTLAVIVDLELKVKSLPALQRQGDIPLLWGSAEKLYRETGWEPKIPFDVTLADLVDWWRRELRGGAFEEH